jgi:predicted CDP-diglyceride synthetase/phosphatidate cytidylyltransferase
MMDPLNKDPTSYSLLTYGWVIGLSVTGGLVSFLRKVREGVARPFNVIELIGEIVTSGFVGVLTFWLCEASQIDALLTAFMVGISGHMGSRLIFQFEKTIEHKLKMK